MTAKITNSLAGLDEHVTIKKMETSTNLCKLHITFPEGERVCPCCGSHHCVIKDSGKEYKVYHSAIQRCTTHLFFRRKRYLCRDCGQTFMQKINWLHDSLHITNTLYFDVCMSLSKPLSIQQIAQQNGIPAAMVSQILDFVPCAAPHYLPSILAIDEFKGNSGTWNPDKKRWNTAKYHTNIVDVSRHSVMDILPFIKAADLKQYFRRFPAVQRERVQFYCCDMHNGYVSVAKEMFPNACVCIDMFHVIKHLNECVSNVRRRLQNRFEKDSNEYKLLKGSRRVLLAKEENLEELYGRRILEAYNKIPILTTAFPDLKEAYDALQHFHLINGMPQGLRRAELSDWLNTYLTSEVAEVRDIARMVRRWRRYIENSWEFHMSSGICEGFNNNTKYFKEIFGSAGALDSGKQVC